MGVKVIEWIILRCAAKSTVALVESLADGGYAGQVWTPTVEVLVRKGPNRSRVKGYEPVTPSFSFAHADRLQDLMVEQRRPASNHPSFSVFRFMGDIPVVSDRALDPLRVAEGRRKPVAQIPCFKVGQKVRTSERGFDGLDGEVIQSQGKWTFVQFPGFFIPVKINTLLLLSNEA